MKDDFMGEIIQQIVEVITIYANLNT